MCFSARSHFGSRLKQTYVRTYVNICTHMPWLGADSAWLGAGLGWYRAELAWLWIDFGWLGTHLAWLGADLVWLGADLGLTLCWLRARKQHAIIDRHYAVCGQEKVNCNTQIWQLTTPQSRFLCYSDEGLFPRVPFVQFLGCRSCNFWLINQTQQPEQLTALEHLTRAPPYIKGPIRNR